MIYLKLFFREAARSGVDAFIDYREFDKVFRKQTFVKTHRTEGSLKTVYCLVINKKRAKRFIQQNINRFLIGNKG